MYSRDMRRDIATLPCLADEIVRDLRIPASARVMDLGCGEGVFLEAIVRNRLRLRADRDVAGIAFGLTGIELDGALASQARARMVKASGLALHDWDIRAGDALGVPEWPKYDYVVGNPPWVRAHHLSPAERMRVRESFSAATGTFDLSHLFIEKGLRLLSPGGTLAMVVPRGISIQPSARRLRAMLDEAGDWRIDPLPTSCFRPSASIDPGLLTLRTDAAADRHQEEEGMVLGDVATVTSGIATGADSVFVLPVETARALELEKDWLRPAVRGRDVRGWAGTAPTVVIWPYKTTAAGHVLADIGNAPRVAAYLDRHQAALEQRPRLEPFIRRHPDEWYRFIDPGRAHYTRSTAFAVPDIACGPAYVPLRSDATAVMNTCFQVIPRDRREQLVRQVLGDHRFWERLRSRSRPLSGGYFRTSASELRALPLTYIVE